MKILALILLLVCGDAHAAAPSLSCTNHRTCDGSGNICTAPVTIMRDCTGSTADTLADGQTAFHSLVYRHTVNDSAAGVWPYGARAGQKKNLMTGPVAAYTFETAGTFTWTTCPEGYAISLCTSTTVVITAANTTFSSTSTTCVYNATLGTGCPSGAAEIQSSDLDAALATAAGSGKRVLFKAGDTFTASAKTTLGAGPQHIGSYGTANTGRAIFKATGALDGFLGINSLNTFTTIQGIEFDGENSTTLFWITFSAGAWHDLLLIGNYVHNTHGYIQPDWNTTGGYGLFLADNRMETPASTDTTDMVLVGAGSYVSIQGNNLSQGTVGQQLIRLNEINKAVVSNNDVSGSAATKETVAMRGGTSVGTQNVVISGNRISIGAGYVCLGITASATDTPASDIIADGNYCDSAASGDSKTGFDIGGLRVSLRNNIVNASNSLFTGAIGFRAGAGTYNAENAWVYNNTVYSSRASGSLTAFSLVGSTSSTNLRVANNLIYGTGGVTVTAFDDTGSKLTKTTNTGVVGAISTNPFSGTQSGSNLNTFACASAAYCATGGTALTPATGSDLIGYADTAGPRIGAVVPTANRGACFGCTYLPIRLSWLLDGMWGEAANDSFWQVAAAR